jgi:CBS domain-containing protein
VETALPQEGPHLVGIVTESDVVRKVLAEEADPAGLTAAEVMVCPLLTIGPERPMMEACHLQW